MSEISNPAFDEKAPGEVITLSFNFSRLTSSVSSPVVTATRHAGADDAAPSGILFGAPQASGAKALQKIVGGVPGTDYLLRCQVDAPDGSRYFLDGVLPVR